MQACALQAYAATAHALHALRYGIRVRHCRRTWRGRRRDGDQIQPSMSQVKTQTIPLIHAHLRAAYSNV
jgi:hypothetical protein